MARFKKISMLASVAMTGIMAISLLITLLPHLFGMTVTVIKDETMAPTYSKGSLLFVKNTDPQKIFVGEIITYYINEGETIKTRRVVAKEPGSHAFYTKGDGQEQMEIGLVSSRNLIGQPVFHLPYLGHLASDQVITLASKVFWLFAGFLTLTTIWMLVEQVSYGKTVGRKIETESRET